MSKQSKILDSGSRTEFTTGAVRDVQENKGRFDLLQVEIFRQLFTGRPFPYRGFWNVALHMEEGCKKYGERNWEKGIPLHCYYNSAWRHLIKHIECWNDEPHARALSWNLLCMLWTIDRIDIGYLPIELQTLPVEPKRPVAFEYIHSDSPIESLKFDLLDFLTTGKVELLQAAAITSLYILDGENYES